VLTGLGPQGQTLPRTIPTGSLRAQGTPPGGPRKMPLKSGLLRFTGLKRGSFRSQRVTADFAPGTLPRS